MPGYHTSVSLELQGQPVNTLLVILFVALGLLIAVFIVLARRHVKDVEQAWAAAASTVGLDYVRDGPRGSLAMEGTWEGYGVVVWVECIGQGRYAYNQTRFQVAYPRQLGFDVEWAGEDLLVAGRKLSGAVDDFAGEDAAPRLTPDRCAHILGALKALPGLEIDSVSVRYTSKHCAGSYDELVGTLRQMLQVAWSLSAEQEKTSSSPPRSR